MVLDTSAFVAGFDPLSVREEQFTAPKVEEEIRANSLASFKFNMAVDSGRLKIKMPPKPALDKVQASATFLGDSFYLSETDMQVLALALDLQAAGYSTEILTDDYSIQNVARQMGLKFVSLGTLGITRVVNWIRYCPACYKVFSANDKFTVCLVCGTKLKRKPKRTEKTL